MHAKVQWLQQAARYNIKILDQHRKTRNTKQHTANKTNDLTL